MLLACVLFFTKTEALITPFLPEGASTDILPLASVMLKIVCLYCLANGINLTMSGTLRASGDTRAVMSIVLFGDFIMIFASYYMIKKLHWNPLITWTFFSASMFIQTILFGLRFWQGRWKDIRVL